LLSHCFRPLVNFLKWSLINFGSYFSIEFQSLLIHGCQPGIIYAIVYAAYCIQSELQIGMYTLGNNNNNDNNNNDINNFLFL
jgi:hypothetical protein